MRTTALSRNPEQLALGTTPVGTASATLGPKKGACVRLVWRAGLWAVGASSAMSTATSQTAVSVDGEASHKPLLGKWSVGRGEPSDLFAKRGDLVIMYRAECGWP